MLYIACMAAATGAGWEMMVVAVIRMIVIMIMMVQW